MTNTIKTMCSCGATLDGEMWCTNEACEAYRKPSAFLRTMTKAEADATLISLATINVEDPEERFVVVEFAVARYSDEAMEDLEERLGTFDLESHSWDGAKTVRRVIQGPMR